MSAQVSSITRNGTTEPFELQVARGQVALHSAVNIFGFNSAITSGTYYPVWESVGAYPTYLTTASVMTIASGSSTDYGAAILISGLDSNFNPISETVVVASGGTASVNSYLRVNSLVVVKPVSGHTSNVGQITATATNTYVYAYIAAGIGKSQMSVYTVPNNCNFYFSQVYVSTGNSYTGSSVYYQAQAYSSTTGVQLNILQQPFINTFNVVKSVPFQFGPKTDLQWQVKTPSTLAVGMVIEGYQIFNSDAGST